MKINKIKKQFGTTAIEYALLAFLISVGIVTAIYSLGSNLSNVYCNVSFALGGKSCAGTTNPADLSLADKLRSSLTDKLDLSYIDASQGGTAKSAGGEWWDPDEIIKGGTEVSLQHELSGMEKINASDPITNVFGIYDEKTGKPINDYNDVLSGINKWLNGNDTSSISTYYKAGGTSGPYGGDMEVTTQSGKVYRIYYGTTEQPHK